MNIMERKVCKPTSLCANKGHSKIKEKTYQELLQDKRWISKRNHILSRDNNTCCFCGCNDRYLHVHHIRYEKDRKPWEYPDEDLITLCERCHKNETTDSKEIYGLFVELKNEIIENGFSIGLLNVILSNLVNIFQFKNIFG